MLCAVYIVMLGLQCCVYGIWGSDAVYLLILVHITCASEAQCCVYGKWCSDAVLLVISLGLCIC